MVHHFKKIIFVGVASILSLMSVLLHTSGATGPVFGSPDQGSTLYPKGNVEFLQNIPLTFSEKTIRSTVYDEPNHMMYVSVNRTVGSEILKIDTVTFETVQNGYLPSGGLNGDIYLDADNNRLVIANYSNPTKVITVNKDTLELISTFTVDLDGEVLGDSEYDVVNNKLYIATDASPSKIYKINVDTQALEATLPLLAGEEYVYNININTTLDVGYVTTYTAPIVLIKFQPSTMTRISSLTLSPGFDWSWTMDINNTFTKAYLVSDDSPAKVTNVDLTTMTQGPTTTLLVDEVTPKYGAQYDDTTDKFYIATSDGLTYTRIIRVNGTTMIRESGLNLTTDDPNAPIAELDETRQKLYVRPRGTVQNKGIITQVDLSTFTRQNSLRTNSDKDMVYSSIADPVKRKAWYMTRSNPFGIVQVNMDTLEESDIEFPSNITGDVASKASAIDVVHNFFLVATDSTTGGVNDKLYKYNTTNLTKMGMLDFGVNTYQFSSVSIDPTGTYAYLGHNGGGKLLKINLNTMLKEAEITLPAFEDYVEKSYVVGDFVYVLTRDVANNVSKVIKFNANTLAREKEEQLSASGGKAFHLMFHDTAKNKLYLTNYGYLTTIDLNNNMQVESLVRTQSKLGHYDYEGFDPITTDQDAGVYDQESGYMYLITYNPTIVVKVRASDGMIAWFDRRPGGAFDEFSTNALFDPVTGNLLVGTANSPSRILKYGVSQEGYIEATKATLNEAATTLSKIKVYIHQQVGNMRVGLYDASKNLVWQSPSTPITKTEDWQEIAIANGTPNVLTNLPAGTYWLGVQVDTGGDVLSFTSGETTGVGFRKAQTYGAFPTTIVGESPQAQRFSIVAVYNESLDRGSTNYPNGGMRRVGDIKLPHYGQDSFGSVLDTSRDLMYVTTSLGEVIKVDVNTNKMIDMLDLGYAGIGATDIVMDRSGTYAYLAAEHTSEFGITSIVKIRLSDMQIVEQMQTSQDEWVSIDEMVLDVTGSYLYALSTSNAGGSPYKVLKIRTNDMTKENSITLGALESFAFHPVIIQSSNILVFGANGKLIRIDLNGFTRMSDISGVAGSTYLSPLEDALITLSTGGGNTTFTRIRTSDFTVTHTYTRTGITYGTPLGIIDTSGMYAYFSHDGINPEILRLNASDLTSPVSISAGATITLPYGFEYHPGRNKIYMVDEGNPTKILPIDLSTFTVGAPYKLPAEAGHAYMFTIDPTRREVYMVTGDGTQNQNQFTVASLDGVTNAKNYTYGVTFANADSFRLPGGIFDSTYSALYWPASSHGAIYKIDPNTKALIGTATLPAGRTIRGYTLNPAGTRMYITTTTSTGRHVIDVINTTTMVYLTASANQADLSRIQPIIYDSINDKLIASGTSSVAGSHKIMRFDPTTLTREATYTLTDPVAGKRIRKALYNPNTQKVVFTYGDEPTNITASSAQYLYTFDIGSFTMDAGNLQGADDIGFFTGDIDIVRNIGYFVSFSLEDELRNVTAVDLATKKVIGVLAMDADEGHTWDGHYDSTNGYFYVATTKGTSEGTGIVKIATSQKGLLNTVQYTLPTNASTVDYFRMYSHNGSGNIRLGFYDQYKNLLWQSNSVANTVTNGWLNIPVSNGTPSSLSNLPAGNYYITFQTDSIQSIGSFSVGSKATSFVMESTFGSFPSSISQIKATFEDWALRVISNVAVFVLETGGNTTVLEGSNPDTYTIVLQSAPENNVTVTTNPTGGLVTTPPSVSFTSSNWNVPQTISVSLPNDNVVASSRVVAITHSLTTSDPFYAGKTVPSINVTILDASSVPPMTGIGGESPQPVPNDLVEKAIPKESSSASAVEPIKSSAPQSTTTISTTPDRNILSLESAIPFEQSLCNTNKTRQTAELSSVNDTTITNYVKALQQKGVDFTIQNGTINGKSTIKRSDFLQVVVQGSCELFGKKMPTEAPFPDVLKSHKDALFIFMAKMRGIVHGYRHDGLFRPDSELSRVEALKVIMEVVLGDGKTTFTGNAKPFKDIPWNDEKAWYRGYISYAFEKGIIGRGDSTTFSPTKPATIEDVIYFFAQTIQAHQSR